MRSENVEEMLIGKSALTFCQICSQEKSFWGLWNEKFSEKMKC